jgi:hypothetical protein
MQQQSKDGTLPQELLRQIANRLRPVCPDIPEDEFTRLVEDVARVKLKYDADENAAVGTSRAVDRSV